MTRSKSVTSQSPAKKRNLPAPTSCFKIMSKWRRLSCPWILLLLVAVTSIGAKKHTRNREDRNERGDENYDIEDEVEKAAREEFREILRSGWSKDGEGASHTSSAADEEGWPWAEGEGGLGDPLCPSPNPRPRPSKTLCEARPCLAHDRCPPSLEGVGEVVAEGGSNERETACCYNGCVYTCMRKMPEPPAFDWIEETPYPIPVGNSSRPMKHEIGNKQSRTAPETVVIAGGCMLSPEQYKHLEGFRQNEHIKKCFCDGGGVFCEVDRGKT